MPKELRCGDLIQGCRAVFKGNSEDEVLKQAAGHAAKAHHITPITPELQEKVKGAIRTV